LNVRLADYTAHIEGWALYSEDLAAEMGVFHSPMEMLGYLSGKHCFFCHY
jgi:uncharacterized protein (DUF885 family)